MDGHTYGFYSVVTDNAGNVEAAKIAAEATTLIDTNPPTSSVNLLPAYSNTTSFTVSWCGWDGPLGSGIATYNVYYSDNGESYRLFKQDTTATSAVFTGLDGHTYDFYSIAIDNAGDVEAAKATAETTTLVDTDPPTSSVDPLPPITHTTTFAVRWGGSDGPLGAGIATYDISYTDSGGPVQQSQKNTTATSALFTGVDGHTYTFYSLATDKADNEQDVPGSSQSTTVVFPADRLAIFVPSQAVAGGSFNVTVHAEDIGGFIDPTYGGSVALLLASSPNGGKMSGIMVEPVVNGVATFNNLSLNKVGGYKLLAASTTDRL